MATQTNRMAVAASGSSSISAVIDYARSLLVAQVKPFKVNQPDEKLLPEAYKPQ
jgi:hypothetical protein